MKRSIIALSALPIIWACGPTAPTGAGGTGGTGGAGGSGAGPSTSTGLPCDVQKVLETRCQVCHSTPLGAGAPMPLTNYDEVTVVRNGRPTWQIMRDRINSNTMPPTGPLDDPEKAILNAWFSAGAPKNTGTCQTGTSPTCIGPSCLPCTPTVFMQAHAGAEGSGQKYSVGAGVQTYVDFKFTSPFKSGESVIASAPIVDNSAVIHHFILYGIDAGGSQTHVAGWAPGGTNGIMPDDVSQSMDAYVSFTMQTHYNNQTGPTAGTAQTDASGLAFCTTTTPRAHLAGVFTLGQYYLPIAPNSISTAPPATCTIQRAMTIIGTSPHMHQLGYGFTTTHARPSLNGTPNNMGYLSNIPDGKWSFDGQRHYPMTPRREMRVGDVITTTCKYQNPTARTVGFGLRTEDEMCFDFMTVYPYSPQMRSCNGLPTP